MKWIIRILYVLGFVLEYVVPVLMFGLVTPLVHGKLNEGLTVVGFIAISILLVIALIKCRDRVKSWDKGLLRAGVLALIKAVPLFVFALLLSWLLPMIMELRTYLWRIIFPFTVGCFLDIVAEYLEAREGDE
jgi:hypothetical protein